MLSRTLSGSVLLLAVAAMYLTRSFIPTRTHQAYPYRSLQNVWTDDELDKLMALVHRIGVYPTTSKDQTSPVEHIGEATPMPEDGKCPHRLMVSNRDGTQCILPHRIDVAGHYLKTGGRASFKERPKRLISRMLSFPKFLIEDLSEMQDEVDTIFKNQDYLDAQSEICEGRNVMDPFQLGIIMQVPGQQVPTHFDAPWFWGASRFTLPQWLLVVMEQSKLWEHLRVRQIQGVAYVHDWKNATDLLPGEINEKYGGGFFFYPEGPGGRVEVFEARRSAAIMLDGSVMVHGTEPFYSGADTVPTISKDAATDLRHFGDGKWGIVSDNETLREYTVHDFRISFVWRSRCFESEEEKERFHSQTDSLSVDEVLDTLVADLRTRGRLGKDQERPAPMELAELLLDEYVKYPLGKGVFPLNFCVVGEVLPSWASNLLTPLCG